MFNFELNSYMPVILYIICYISESIYVVNYGVYYVDKSLKN